MKKKSEAAPFMENLLGQLDRDHVLGRFQRMYESIGSKITPNTVQTSSKPPDQFTIRKTVVTEKKELQRLIPITVSEMELDFKHHGRFIRGTLIVDPFVTSTVQTIFEDEKSEIVHLSIHNKHYNKLPAHLKWQYSHHQYKCGLKIIILEPLFIVAKDGTIAIRVENPNHIILIESIPATALEVKDEANKMFDAENYCSAIDRYDDAINALDDLDMYRAIFQNLSMVHLKMNQPAHAVRYAVAAVSCGGNTDKAYFRLASALDTMGYKNAALFCCNKVKDSVLARNDIGFRDLYNTLKKSGPPIKNLWDDERVVKAMCIIKPGVRLLGKTSAAELKQLGNDCFLSKLFEQAQIHYEQALMQLEATSNVRLAPLMSSKAMCCVHLDKFSLAVKEASCALLLNSLDGQALYAQAESLLNLGWIDEAGATIIYAKNIHNPGCRTFDTLNAHLLSKPSKKKHSEYSDDDIPLQQWIFENERTDMRAKDSKIRNRNINNFYKKYVQTTPWPIAANPFSCERILREAYEYARSARSEASFFEGMIDSLHLFRRMGSIDPVEIMWYHRARIGDLRQRPRNTSDGFGMIYRVGMITHQNYGNIAQMPQKMEGSTTHVAFGFADLQELCIADLSNCSPQSPLKWIGYDKSPYVIAKTMVLIEMMKSCNDSDAVVQVWYSTAWTRGTLRQFRKALKTVLAFPSVPESVRTFLLAWQQYDVELSEAREKWKKTKKTSWCTIANWTREQDQIAMCTYALTGQLQNEAHVGSNVMYAFPYYTEKIEDDQDVIGTIKIEDILRQCDAGSQDCLTAINSILNDRVGRVMSLLKAGSVTVEVRLGAIGIDEKDVIATVRSIQPASMSWSNLCDCLEIKEFFAITKACSSVKGTKHFGYSIDWPMEVKGAFAIDYVLEDEVFREIQLKTANKYYKEQLNSQIPLSERYLYHQAVTNPFEVVDYELQSNFCQHWVQNNIPIPCKYTFSEWTPIYKTTSALFFTFDTTRSES